MNFEKIKGFFIQEDGKPKWVVIGSVVGVVVGVFFLVKKFMPKSKVKR